MLKKFAGKLETFLRKAPLNEPPEPTLTIRPQKAPSPTSHRPSNEKQPLLGLHILVAEDNPDLQIIMSRLLTRYGATVEVVDNGSEAAEKALEGQPYNIILLDLHMPVLDGYSTLNQLRKNGFGGPIVAVTCEAVCLFDTIKGRGFTEVITKPTDAEDFISVICKYR